MTPLRIGIACYPTFGGSGILATELGVALADRGHEVHLLAYSVPPRLPPDSKVKSHRVNVSAYPLFKFPPYDLALAAKMRELLVEVPLDILHVHYAIPHALCAYLARQMAPETRAKVITTLHGTDITVVGSDSAYREVTCFGLQHSDRVIAVSEYLAGETRRIFGDPCDIVVIPNFVDTRRFAPLPAPREPGAERRIIHISNFRPVKRPQDVVRAFARIAREIDGALVLVGDGPELAPCLELARDLDVHDRVDAVGPVSDVETLLASSSLLLQPSGSEAFGLAALEAMSCGVPVVGYRVGGLPEVVVDGETGFLVPFQRVDTLAARALEILQSPALAERFSRAGRARAEALFSIDGSVLRHEQLYREALADG